MKRTLIIAALFLSGCATQKPIERHQVLTDTFHAVIAEQMSVCLDDVVILPCDTLRPIVVARRAEIRRKSAAEVNNIIHEQLDETPPPASKRPASRFVFTLILLAILALFIFALRKSN